MAMTAASVLLARPRGLVHPLVCQLVTSTHKHPNRVRGLQAASQWASQQHVSWAKMSTPKIWPATLLIKLRKAFLCFPLLFSSMVSCRMGSICQRTSRISHCHYSALVMETVGCGWSLHDISGAVLVSAVHIWEAAQMMMMVMMMLESQ